MALTYAKFERRCAATGNRASMYALLHYRLRHHYRRLKAFIDRMPRKLVCQECGGSGGGVEPVLDYGEGPWEDCHWCAGIGYVTPWVRGRWLAMQRK